MNYVNEFEGLWDFNGNPEFMNEMLVSFSDQGAWHGYVMPAVGGDWRPGFNGPFTYPVQAWRLRQFGLLKIIDANGQAITDFSDAVVEKSCFPHKLRIKMGQNGWNAVEELGFLDGRTSGILIGLTNNTGSAQEIRLAISGEAFPDAGLAWHEKEGMVWGNAGIDFVGFRVIAGVDVSLKSDGFSFTTQALKLEAGETAEFKCVIAADFDEASMFDHLIRFSASDVRRIVCEENVSRWNGYFDSVLSRPGDLIDPNDQTVRRMTAKSIAALIYNWFSPAGDLPCNSVFPSLSDFTKNWAWDTWKHSAALAFYNPFLAKEGIRTMLERQRGDGMIPDTVGFNKDEDNWADTKPPLASWAAWTIFCNEREKDLDFLREVYPALMTFHRWWYASRDVDGDGLCEYGSEVYDFNPAKWESGMDNSIRYDEMDLIPNNAAWSMNITSVDLNAYLYADKLYLAEIAGALGLQNDAVMLQRDAHKLKMKINERMFAEDDGIYYDLRVPSGEFIRTKSPAAWIPMWAELADRVQADGVYEHIVNPKEFWTFVPFPTASRDDPKFENNGYWRGPVWLDQAYFGVKALLNYGFTDAAIEGTKRLFHNVDSARGTNSIRELYDPDTGEGLNAKNFGWSSAAYIMLYLGR